jgi:hypothetical protein
MLIAAWNEDDLASSKLLHLVFEAVNTGEKGSLIDEKGS